MTGLRVRGADVAWLAIGVVGVSMSGPLIAAIVAPALAVAFWRNAMGTIVLAPLATRHLSGFRALAGRPMVPVVVAGVALAAHFGFWVSSLRLTSVAASTALVCMQAGFVVLIAWARGEPASRRVVGGLGVCVLGVLIITGVDFTVSREAVVGDLLALAGGAAGAIYVIAGGVVRRRTDTTVYTFACYGLCAVVLLVICLLWDQQLLGYAAVDWWRLVALTVAAQLFGHSAFNHVLATVSPTVVALVMLLEVPGAALLAGWWLGQSPPPGVYAGLVLLLAGLALVITSRQEESVEAMPPD